MDFAPYQDTNPETTRALSPPPTTNPRRISSPPLTSPRNAPTSNPWGAIRSSSEIASPKPLGFANDGSSYQNSSAGAGYFGGAGNADGGGGNVEEGRGGRLNEFETSLPIRLDYEACLAYLLLPPAGGVLLLVLEHKSDYVRFHAWQSSILFSISFVLHLILSWSRFLSWVLLLVDVGAIGYLTMRAYRDADTLDRCEVPYIGRLASNILDDE